jgi:hypothetical protein
VLLLLKMSTVEGIQEGRITAVYRRWKKPHAKVGGRQRTPLGTLTVVAVQAFELAALGESDAAAAGLADLATLLAELQTREGTVYRIGLAPGGPDVRVALRARAALTEEDVVELKARLARKDRKGPWTTATLRLISGCEGVRAGDLAQTLGMDKALFKRRVRSLKELGLTESLEVGYRLSPRGRALLLAVN